MNYRHIYHAGNFADVFKHAVLARLIVYMQQKDKAFRLLDTHAGIGLYDLSSAEAQKTGEWRNGIGRLMERPIPENIRPILAPYLDAVAALNPDGGISTYPGSPKLARMLFRPQDRLSAMELHPVDSETLRRRFEGDFQVRVTELDGWLALGAHLPPKEKRGIVLVDPPFEEEGEYDRLVKGLKKARARFPGGVYCLWYPLKRGAPVEEFRAAFRNLGIPKILSAELWVKSERDTTGLAGSGLIIVNPPYTLHGELSLLLPFLKDRLRQDQAAGTRLEWLAADKSTAGS